MNGLLNQQTKHFSVNEFISSLATELLHLVYCKDKVFSIISKILRSTRQDLSRFLDVFVFDSGLS